MKIVKVVADYYLWFFFHIGEIFTLNHCVSVIDFIFFAFRFSLSIFNNCLNFGLAITFKQKKIGTVAGSDERACDQVWCALELEPFGSRV
jgi:hypothetical protein